MTKETTAAATVCSAKRNLQAQLPESMKTVGTISTLAEATDQAWALTTAALQMKSTSQTLKIEFKGFKLKLKMIFSFCSTESTIE